jgi:hypothetical protein
MNNTEAGKKGKVMRLTRANRSRFAEYQELQRVRRYIQTNRSQFRAGRGVNLTQVLAEFGLEEPDYSSMSPEQAIKAYNSFTVKRSTITKRFNNILAERGMYLRKKPNENMWLLRETERVEAKVERLWENAEFRDEEASVLETGLTNHQNSYSYVHNKTLKRIVAKTVNRW